MSFVATSNKDLKVGRVSEATLCTPAAMLESTWAFKHFYVEKTPRGRPIKGKTKPLLVKGSPISKAIPAPRGLVSSVLQAYNNHFELVLRPDDFWLTILAQLSAYVNGRAEELRGLFVEHDGKKELEVVDFGNIHTVDFGSMTRRMLDEIGKNIKDASMRDWFLPGFTTSTPVDDVCASATAMATLQDYFEYKLTLMCGIPKVTLLGTVDDWLKLRAKIDRLADFDTDDRLMTQWLALLVPVCDNLVVSAQSGSSTNLHFWDTIAHRIGAGSGPKYLSGWITTFSFFDADGKPTKTSDVRSSLKNEGPWLVIDTNDLNANVVSCPVKIDDNGTPYQSRLFVGQMAVDIVTDAPTPVVVPRNDWVLAIELD